MFRLNPFAQKEAGSYFSFIQRPPYTTLCTPMDDQSTQVWENDIYDAYDDDDDDDASYATAIEDLIESPDERAQIENDILEFIAEFMEEHALCMSSPDFVDEVVDATMDAFSVPFGDEHYDTLCDWFSELVDEYYSWGVVPQRSRETVPEVSNTRLSHIDNLRKIPQPEQRTAAWFQFRHNVITASSVGKMFASNAQLNSLIYEKCKPVAHVETTTTPNFDSPLHWGQKYEPLSVLIYEHMYDTKVGAFGCIPHPTCKCLAASPDGINVDPTSTRFGRMLEIKNVVNREITGIPLEAYWIQMQVQMEVCDLDTCDFLETRFLEYPDADAFWDAVELGSNPEYLGIMLLFLDANYRQHRYEIMPIDVSLEIETVMEWIEGVRQCCQGWRLYQTIYWYLEEFSCVMVDRNRIWFADAKPRIESTWTTIVYERIHGHEHRAPSKRGNSDSSDVARSNAALAQLFATANEDRLVEAIQSDLSIHDLVKLYS